MRNLLGLSLSVMFVTACTVLPFAVIALSQDSQIPQNQSVADVARRSLDRKKNTAKKSRVITNDDLEREHFKPGQDGLDVVGPGELRTGLPNSIALATALSADQDATSASEESGPKGRESKKAAAEDAQIAKLKEQLVAGDAEIARLKQQLAEDAELAKLKDQLAEAQNQLTWQERELMLDQHTIYSNPNYTDYRTGQAKLTSDQQRISETEQEIDALEGPIAELEWRQWRRTLAASSESIPPAP
jgi:hypothetical protein